MLKPKLIFFILILAYISFGCEERNVYFQEPQPKLKRNLKKIPKEYLGEYINVQDSSILTISPYFIIQDWSAVFHIAIAELEEENDTVYAQGIDSIRDENWKITFDRTVDSAFVAYNKADTLFHLNHKAILRKYKGHLFLNYHISESKWKVKTLSLNNNVLAYENLITLSEIDSLKEIVPIKAEIDTTRSRNNNHLINVSKRDIKKILRQKSYEGKFIKLNIE